MEKKEVKGAIRIALNFQRAKENIWRERWKVWRMFWNSWVWLDEIFKYIEEDTLNILITILAYLFNAFVGMELDPSNGHFFCALPSLSDSCFVCIWTQVSTTLVLHSYHLHSNFLPIQTKKRHIF